MELLAHLAYHLSKHRFLAIPIIIGLVFWLILRRRNRSWRAYDTGLVVLLLVFMLVNLFATSMLSTYLLHRVGQAGQALVTGIYNTNTRYNHHLVRGYHVLIKTVEGKTVETGFEDDEFNVYPNSGFSYLSYPQEGDTLQVRYLREFPQDFTVLVSNNSSQDKELRCLDLKHRLQEARRKYRFDPGNADYRQAYLAAIQAVITNQCFANSLEVQEYYSDFKKPALRP